MLLMTLMVAVTAIVPINGDLLPYGVDNMDCGREECIVRNLPPVDKTVLQAYVNNNMQLWNTTNEHTIDKTNKRGQIWLRLTSNDGSNQYEFPLWHELKDMIMPILHPYVTKACQLLRVSFSFIDPARHPRYIVPHSDTGRWALYSHRIHHPLSGSPTMFYWSHPDVGNHSVEVSSFNRYEWNNIQRHSVTYLGDEIRVHLISDILDDCPDPVLIPVQVATPNLCRYEYGDLHCRKEGEADVFGEEEKAYGEDAVEDPITGRKKPVKAKKGKKARQDL